MEGAGALKKFIADYSEVTEQSSTDSWEAG